jgi:hypothetical protein
MGSKHLIQKYLCWMRGGGCLLGRPFAAWCRAVELECDQSLLRLCGAYMAATMIYDMSLSKHIYMLFLPTLYEYACSTDPDFRRSSSLTCSQTVSLVSSTPIWGILDTRGTAVLHAAGRFRVQLRPVLLNPTLQQAHRCNPCWHLHVPYRWVFGSALLLPPTHSLLQPASLESHGPRTS